MHGCLHGAWRYTQARLTLSLGGLLPHARLPSHLRSSPGAASLRAPHTPLSVRGACEEGQGPGCPQPTADPKAPIT